MEKFLGILALFSNQEITRIHKISNFPWNKKWKIMYHCIFLFSRKLQGYITFQNSQLKAIELRNLKSYVSLYFPPFQEITRIHNFSKFSTPSHKIKKFKNCEYFYLSCHQKNTLKSYWLEQSRNDFANCTYNEQA